MSKLPRLSKAKLALYLPQVNLAFEKYSYVKRKVGGIG